MGVIRPPELSVGRGHAAQLIGRNLDLDLILHHKVILPHSISNKVTDPSMAVAMIDLPPIATRLLTRATLMR